MACVRYQPIDMVSKAGKGAGGNCKAMCPRLSGTHIHPRPGLRIAACVRSRTMRGGSWGDGSDHWRARGMKDPAAVPLKLLTGDDMVKNWRLIER
jgi:hypothetical protein